jgi:molybdopterin molybdotransferase
MFSSENKMGSRQALLSLEDAIRIATSFACIIERSETVPLANSIGRRLSHDLIAPLDLPPFDQSAMDGFALSGPGRNESYAVCRAKGVRAGDIPNLISPGQATRIATGACIPEGADRVVMHEHTVEQEDRIVLGKGVERGPTSAYEVKTFVEASICCRKAQRWMLEKWRCSQHRG